MATREEGRRRTAGEKKSYLEGYIQALLDVEHSARVAAIEVAAKKREVVVPEFWPQRTRKRAAA